jgi:hypothetical protein
MHWRMRLESTMMRAVAVMYIAFLLPGGAHALGKVDPDIYEWTSLSQMDEDQKAKIKTKANTVKVNPSIIPFEELSKGTQVKDGTFPGLEGALQEATAGADWPGTPVMPALFLPSGGGGHGGVPELPPEKLAGDGFMERFIEFLDQEVGGWGDGFDPTKYPRVSKDAYGGAGGQLATKAAAMPDIVPEGQTYDIGLITLHAGSRRR